MPQPKLRRVLIIENDASVRNALLTLLAGLGCETDVAYTGKQAIEIIRSEKFDAVLLDLRCAHTEAEELVPTIHSLRPSLLANVLVITGDVADAKTLDLIERYLLLHVSGNRPIREMISILRVMMQLPPLPDTA